MRLATTTYAPRHSVLNDLASSVIKVVLSFSDGINRLADAHDARQRFAHLDERQLADIGLTPADRDFRINR
jgi:uncharacterized protein YjiS (DUF1127 family)